jgi:peptide/nickel transport system substrate-binding protein
VGIKTELVVQPYQQHNAALQRGDHDLALFGWIGDTGDPDNFLYVLFDSESAHGADPQNVAFYENPEVDRLLAQAQATGDERERSSLYAEVQDQISDDAPWVPIAHAQLVVAGRAELEHVIISPTGHPIFPLITRAEQR